MAVILPTVIREAPNITQLIILLNWEVSGDHVGRYTIQEFCLGSTRLKGRLLCKYESAHLWASAMSWVNKLQADKKTFTATHTTQYKFLPMFSNSSGLKPILVLTVNLNITVIESVIKTSVRSGSYAHNMKYGVNTSTWKTKNRPALLASGWTKVFVRWRQMVYDMEGFQFEMCLLSTNGNSTGDCSYNQLDMMTTLINLFYYVCLYFTTLLLLLYTKIVQ